MCIASKERQRPVSGSTMLPLTQAAAPNWAAWEYAQVATLTVAGPSTMILVAVIPEARDPFRFLNRGNPDSALTIV